MSRLESAGNVETPNSAEIRSALREIFLHALSEAAIQTAFDRHISCERGVLRISEDLYELSAYSRVFVVSIGKAGNTMAAAFANKVGSGIEGIVVASTDPDQMVPGFQYFRGGHPTPNEDSVRAGATILRALQSLPERSLVIYLLSGGGSSIVEKPISEDITLRDLIETYRVLVHSGAPIAQINAIRKHISAVKGGRLARAAAPAHQVAVMVSDVPENALDSLASGPTIPDSSTLNDCYMIVEKYGMLPQFPSSVRRLFEERDLEETPKPGSDVFARSRWWLVLSNGTALKAAAEKATAAGFTVEVDNSCDDWDYAQAADYLLNRFRELRSGGTPVCLISGGEVTVKVTGGGGVGGRNQQFALYSATKIAGENIAVLSAGTDGVDGNSPAAGAIADGTTLQRAQQLGLDAQDALASFNAFPFFQSLGDSLMTGPTGNNVRDLRILIAY